MTGSSGSGKSSLLPYIIERYERPTSIASPTADLSKPLIDAWPAPPTENIARLTRVGLGDPVQWCRTYQELSVGQQARFRIADLLTSTAGLIVIDEWLNGLDEITARAVAWSTCKLLRSQERSAILVTSQHYLLHDAQPHLWADVASMATAIAVFQDASAYECSVLSECSYHPGTAADWLALKRFHYAAGSPATVHSYHTIRHPQLKHPAAVALLSYPDLNSSARNLALKDLFKDTAAPGVAQQLNRSILRLSRIVVAPELRQIGMANWLINEMINRVTVPYIECSTSMARYSPFLSKAGFLETPQAQSQFEAAWMDFATQNALPGYTALSGTDLRAAVQNLSVRKARKGHQLAWDLYHHLVLHRRTRTKKPDRVPNLDDSRWSDAFDLAARRINDRPAYWLLKTPASQAHEETTQCPSHQRNPANDQSNQPDSPSAPPSGAPTKSSAPTPENGSMHESPPPKATPGAPTAPTITSAYEPPPVTKP